MRPQGANYERNCNFGRDKSRDNGECAHVPHRPSVNKKLKPQKHGLIHPEYFTIPQLSVFSGLGPRFLRDSLKHPEHPLPHFRLNSKTILISREDLAEWLEHFRGDRGNQVDQLVRLVVAGVTK